MQPLQYDLRCPAAKDNSIMHATTAPSNLDAATTVRSAVVELQNTTGLRAAASAKSGSKSLPARICTKTAVFQPSQKGNQLRARGPPSGQNLAPKGPVGQKLAPKGSGPYPGGELPHLLARIFYQIWR